MKPRSASGIAATTRSITVSDAVSIFLNHNFQLIAARYDIDTAEAEKLTARLRPIVEDARVFMDKIAREPGRLVGGALNQGPGIK